MIKQKASDAHDMLLAWKTAYQEVRKKIEQSGRDARWEFDRKKLFERSDHIAQVCKDICGIVQVCTYIHVCSYKYMYIYMYQYMHFIKLNPSMHTCMCIYICTCTHTVHTCTYVQYISNE